MVGCESARRFVLYDVDASLETRTLQKQVMWEPEEEVVHWDASLMTTEDGQVVLYLLYSELEPDIQWYASICCCSSMA